MSIDTESSTNNPPSAPSQTVAIIGANGTMGRAVQKACEGKLNVSKIDYRSEIEGNDWAFGTLEEGARFSRPLDVVIDFSTPDGCLAAAHWCKAKKIPFVSGTTGLSPSQLDDLRSLSTSIPILHAANFSLGIAVLRKAVAEVARLLPSWDAEIIDVHHRRKKDSPSGTALLLGRTIADARQQNFDAVANLSNERRGPRKNSEIAFQALRAGNIVGDHTCYFVSDLERIELTHRASDRSIFASGAVESALWIIGKPPALYAIDDVISG